MEKQSFEKEKGASDLLAYYVHRPIENWITLRLMRTSITPNQITLMVNLLAYLVAASYFFGYLLQGSILSFLVGLLDGVDGKLARAKNQTSRLGKMEHAFDLLFEFTWLITFALYLQRSLNSSLPLILASFSMLFISFYRYCYDTFSRTMGTSLDTYGNFERIFRRIAGRRNLYNIHILIGVLLGFPQYSLVSVMAHAMLTAMIYAWRTAKHLYAVDRKEQLTITSES